IAESTTQTGKFGAIGAGVGWQAWGLTMPAERSFASPWRSAGRGTLVGWSCAGGLRSAAGRALAPTIATAAASAASATFRGRRRVGCGRRQVAGGLNLAADGHHRFDGGRVVFHWEAGLGRSDGSLWKIIAAAWSCARSGGTFRHGSAKTRDG